MCIKGNDFEEEIPKSLGGKLGGKIMKFDYYTPPSDEIFEDIKTSAIKLWKTYDDNCGYATDKINSIKDLKNIGDNAWYMVAMFDRKNQAKLLQLVSSEAAELIKQALKG